MNLTKVVVYLEQPGDAFNCEQIGLCNLHLGGEMSLRTSLLKSKSVSEKVAALSMSVVTSFAPQQQLAEKNFHCSLKFLMTMKLIGYQYGE